MLNFYRRILCFFVFLVPFLTGCVKTGKIKYSGVYYFVKKSTTMRMKVGNDEPVQIKSNYRRRLKASKTTIAFFPPDSCASLTSQGYRSRREQDFLRTKCGVMMSRLQNRAIRMGFKVLSWKQLRGSKRPIDYAREQKVDFLFVVNEFGRNDNRLGELWKEQLHFFRAQNKPSKLKDTWLGPFQLFRAQNKPSKLKDTGPLKMGPLKPMQVSPTVGVRCNQFLKKNYPVKRRRTTVSLNVNMVDVKSGRVSWNYRREMGFKKDKEWTQTDMGAWAARNPGFVYAAGVNIGATTMIAGGFVLFGLSSIILIGGAERVDDHLELWGGFVVVSVLLGVGGVVWGVLDPPKMRPNSPIPKPSAPAKVMCQTKGLGFANKTRGFHQSSKAKTQSSFSFSSKNTPSQDKNREKIDRLMKFLIDDFFVHMKK